MPFRAAWARSFSEGLGSIVLATRALLSRAGGRSVGGRGWAGAPSSSEPHAVAVAVGGGALGDAPRRSRVAHLAEDDHTRRAPVDAQGTAGAHVVVDGEDDVVGRGDPGLVDPEGLDR